MIILEDGKRCPVCRPNRKLAYEETANILQEIAKEYTFITKPEEYANTEKIKLRHKKCNYEFLTSLAAVKRGRGCPNCADNKRYDISFIKNFIENNTNEDQYILESTDYINNNTLLEIRHLRCNTVFKMDFAHFKRGERCPKCRMSKGEVIINTFLKNKQDLQFESQKVFLDCRFKKPLKFDFYIKNCNLLIEYDGIQHYKLWTVIGYKKNPEKAYVRFINSLKRDKIKNIYCQTKNINLLRIPYTEFSNIEIILNKTLEYFNNTNGKTFNEFIDSLQLKIPIIEGVKNNDEQFRSLCN